MAARVFGAGSPHVGVLIVGGVGVAHALALVLVPLRAAPLAGYAGASSLTLVPDLVAGMALLASGLIALTGGRHNRVAALAMLASIAWWAPIWVSWDGGWAFVRSVGLVVAPFLVPILLDLVVTATRGRGKRGAAIVNVTYAIAMIASLGRALVRDPFLDLDCAGNCRDNVFLLFPDRGLASTLDTMLELGALLGASAIVVYSVIQGALVRRQDRLLSLTILVPGSFVGVAEAAYATALVRSPLEVAVDPLFVNVFLARAIATSALAIGVTWAVLWERMTRTRISTAAVSRIARDLAAATGPGGLRDALALALSDPDLRVAYWLPDAGIYVDETDARVDITSLPAGRIATPVVRGSERIALVIHRPGVDPDTLTRDIGSAARLAAENERLQAEIRRQISDLRGSRRRIVAAADDSRRRLERDLHDGAQQRLLALSYELRLGETAAERDGQRDLATILSRASTETHAALDDLRELAHGIFPAILAEAGLNVALGSLVDRSPVPMDLSIELESRCPAATETTAYLVIDEAVRSAARRGATGAAVRVTRSEGLLQVRVDDDAPAPLEDMTHLIDRVGALGGRLTGRSASRAHALEAEIPCA